MFSAAIKGANSSTGSTTDPNFKYVTLLLHGDGTNGAQNNTFLDSSTNAATVTRVSTATQGNFTPFNYCYSTYFEGSAAQYYSLPTAQNVQLGSLATTTYGAKTTIEFWAYQTATSSTATFFNTGVFGNQNGGATNGRYAIYMDGTAAGSTQAVTFQYSTSTTTTATVTTTATAPINTWNHIAITIDTTTPSTSTIVIYINGTGQTFSSQNLSTHTTDPGVAFTIGWDQLSDKFTGYITSFRFSRGSTLVYTGNFTPNTQKFIPDTSTKVLALQNAYAIDESPYNMTLTPTTGAATPTVMPFAPYSDYQQPTPTSYSGFFDGTGDYITFPNTTALQMSTGDFTWECWIFINKISTLMGVMGLGTASTGLEISVTASNNIRASYTATNLTGTTTLTANTWYHVALVRSGSSTGNVKIYLNGALEATSGTAVTDNFNQTNSQVVGDVRATGTPFNGLISNVRIAKGVAVYTGTFTVPTSPLAATQSSGTNIAAITGVQTSLLTCQSSSFIDNSTFAYVPTTLAQAQPDQYNPFGYTVPTSLQPYSAAVTGGSINLNGSSDYLSLANATALDLATGTPNWTIECWAYVQTTTSGAIFLQKDGVSGTRQSQYGLSTTGGVLSPASGSGGNQNINGTTWYLNVWMHIAMVRSGSQIYLFQNGIQTVSTALTIVMGNNTGPLTIGANNPGASYTTGYIAYPRIIKGTALYVNSFVPPTSPLTAVTNTQMLIAATNYASPDNAIQNNFVTAGNAQLSTTVKRFGTASWSFDGTGDYLKQNLSSIDTSFGSGNFTIEFWMYANALPPSDKDVIAKGHQVSGALFGSFLFIYKSTGDLVFNASSTGGSYNIYNGALIGNLSATTWYAIALTRSGSSWYAYVNGTLAAGWPKTSTATLFNQASTTLAIAADSTGGTNFNGYLDEIRFTKGVARYTGSTYTVQTAPFPDQ